MTDPRARAEAPIRGRTSSSFLRYCLMGVVNAGLGIGMTALLHEVLRASEELAYAVTLATVFVVNFFVSRHYIYDASGGSPVRQFTGFLFSSASFRLLEYASFLLLHSWLGLYYLAAVVVVQVTSFLGKFGFYRTFIFVGGRREEPGSWGRS